MNPALSQLQPYPFERLAQLLKNDAPPEGQRVVSLAIGEPQHSAPAAVLEAYRQGLVGIGQYPSTLGSAMLREHITRWLEWRFRLGESALDAATQVLPVNGTREALFAFAQAVIDPGRNPLVVMPNPFYQIYEGAALLARATPYFLPETSTKDHRPDLTQVADTVWQRCQLLYLCSPGNPSGAVLSLEQLQQAIRLAERYDFVIASDECYSEIYLNEENPPAGLLEAAYAMGNTQFKRCVVFHSLSKRSNVPGLRSGFVAGDAAILQQFLLYRTYHGCAMSPAVQAASVAAWRDEIHVRANRDLYREKFDAVVPILSKVMPIQRPTAGFYLWPQTGMDDEQFTRRALSEQAVRLIPGRYLAREVNGHNPGAGRVRLSLVPSVADCIEAAQRLVHLF